MSEYLVRDRSQPKPVSGLEGIAGPMDPALRPVHLATVFEKQPQFRKIIYPGELPESELPEVTHLFPEGNATVIAQHAGKHYVLRMQPNDRLIIGPGTLYAIVVNAHVNVLATYPQSVGLAIETPYYSPEEVLPQARAELETAVQNIQGARRNIGHKTKDRKSKQRLHRDKHSIGNSGLIYIIRDGECYSSPDSFTNPEIVEHRILDGSYEIYSESEFVQTLYRKHIVLLGTEDKSLSKEQLVILGMIRMIAQKFDESLKLSESPQEEIIDRIADYFFQREDAQLRRQPVVAEFEKFEKGEEFPADLFMQYILHYAVPKYMKKGNFLEAAVDAIQLYSHSPRDLGQPINLLKESEGHDETPSAEWIQTIANRRETFLLGLLQVMTCIGLHTVGMLNAPNYEKYKQAFSALNIDFSRESFSRLENEIRSERKR